MTNHRQCVPRADSQPLCVQVSADGARDS